jgi:hypothetical protein
MDSRSIDQLHRTKTDKVSDKWASYLAYYDALFLPLRDAPVRLLEIGVQNGGSLDTWSRYFAAGQLFVGCDIDEKCKALAYVDPRVKIVVGDANGQSTFDCILAQSPRYDIIIDDGSHVSFDILTSFVNYFALLDPGGIYVIEDAHCLYIDQYGGGLLNETGAYAFFKRLADVVNFQFWGDVVSIHDYLRTFFGKRSTPAFIVEGWVESIEFRNSIITVRKSPVAGHNKLGDRVIVGESAQVHPPVGRAGSKG